MSHWNVGPDPKEDEVVALKRQIANQDIRYSHVESQLLKVKDSFEETKAALSDTHQKLRTEADRALNLEQRLTQSEAAYEKEKLFRQNAETALNAASEKIKAEELIARNLQETIETLAGRENDNSSIVSSLQRDKARLENRVQELEVNLQQIISSATPAKSRTGRPRSSDFSDVRIKNLERELNEARSLSTTHESDLQAAKEKCGRMQTDLIRAENEKSALERKMLKEVNMLKERLAEKEEEAEQLRAQQGDGGLGREREEELIQRIEEEEAKVLAMEKLVQTSGNMKTMQDALQRAEKKLALEMVKTKAGEERASELVREKEGALDLLDCTRVQVENLTRALQEKDFRIDFLDSQERELRSQLAQARSEQQNNLAEEFIKRPGSTTFDEGLLSADDGPTFPLHSTPLHHSAELARARTPSVPPPDDAAVEKLLSAIDRLRGERDGLRRDLEYLQAESKFTIQAMEEKLAVAIAGVHSTDTIEQFHVEINTLREQLSKASHGQAQPVRKPLLELKTIASLIMVGHLQSRLEDQDRDAYEELERSRAEMDLLHLQLDDATSANEDQQRIIVELDETLNQTHSRLEACLQDLHNTEYRRDELIARVSLLQSQINELKAGHAQTETDLQQAEEQLSEYARVYESLESERDSLGLQVNNLEMDLVAAQEDLAEAQRRYSNLQTLQLSTMSSGDVTRTLKSQIEELEDRVLRRTELIGLQQHDIKRLEVNLTLQEDRIAEMTQELETVITEKKSMVEDCAEAREARDVALRRVEDLEEELETFEARLERLDEQRETETTTLIGLWAGVVSQSRVEIYDLRSTLYETHTANTGLLDHIANQEETVTALWDDNQYKLEAARNECGLSDERSRQATIALAVSQVELRRKERLLATQLALQIGLEDQFRVVQGELAIRITEIESLRKQLESVRSQQSQENEVKALELQEKLEQLQHSNAELELERTQLQQALETSQSELQSVVGEHTERMRASAQVQQELEQLRASFEEETKQLHNRLSQATTELQKIQLAHAEAIEAQKASLEEVVQSRKELEAQLQRSHEQHAVDQQLTDQLEAIRTTHRDELQNLRSQLDQAARDLQDATRMKDELEASHHRTIDEARLSQADLEAKLSKASAATQILEQEVDRVKSRHAQELVELQERLQSSQSEAADLQTRLKVEMADRNASDAECRTVQEQYEVLRTVEADLRETIATLQSKAVETDTFLRSLEMEKLSLEQEATGLEAAMQRGLSMQKFLEKQVRDGENEMNSLKADLSRLHADHARSEQACKSAQMELSLKSGQHEHAVSSLRRELDILRTHPKQGDIIAELNEKVQMMDDLMRSKTQEIEENDDRFIELLKEKKKMTAKMENLARKVQSLQNKLATIKDASSTLPPQKPQPPAPSRQPHSASSMPVTTAVAASHISQPVLSQSSSTPRSRSRMPSGPSVLPRPKTPDSRPPVFRAKTPESRAGHSAFQSRTPERSNPPIFQTRTPGPMNSIPQPDFSGPLQTTSSIGKKRSAPDDPDEYAPVQGFTVDGALDQSRGIDSATPRMRKNLRTGFTPIRNTTARPMTTLTHGSPMRMSDPAILDVTNSPRTLSRIEPKAAKRGWLGRIRGVSSGQSSSSLNSQPRLSRPGVFERATGGHAS